MMGQFVVSCPANIGIKTIENTLETIVIYPNPTSGKTSLEYNSNDLISEVTVRNYAGQIVSSHKNIHQNKLELDLSSLAEGIYLTEIKTSQGVYSRKLSVVK